MNRRRAVCNGCGGRLAFGEIGTGRKALTCLACGAIAADMIAEPRPDLRPRKVRKPWHETWYRKSRVLTFLIEEVLPAFERSDELDLPWYRRSNRRDWGEWD
ncbi:hypothetical protein [Tropicibacter sp. S64]|uniref:hypothetical protein n=1 Tax=Tropicibacter sp. S64 TaxID=3415122 RepID=UPI003C79DC26